MAVVVRSCCCGCSLKDGVLVIAFLSLVREFSYVTVFEGFLFNISRFYRLHKIHSCFMCSFHKLAVVKHRLTAPAHLSEFGID